MTGPVYPIDGLIEVEIRKPRLRLGLIFLLAFGSVFLIVPIAAIANSLPNKRLVIAFISVLSLIGLLLVLLYFRRRSKRLREARQKAVEKGVRSCAAFIADYLPKENGVSLVRGALKELLSASQTNVTIRVLWKPAGPAIDPIENPFGPLRLDESDPDFIQFEQAINPDEIGSDATTPGRLSIEEQSTIRNIARNLRLKGGWIMLAIFGFNATRAIVESFEKSQITISAMIWVGFFAMFLFMSPTSGPFSNKQWLIVPGGLLLRRPSKRMASESQLHLFDRRNSALCVNQIRKQAWSVCVTDGIIDGWTQATTREMILLLRAWLSPLEPPPVEKLVDLQ